MVSANNRTLLSIALTVAAIGLLAVLFVAAGSPAAADHYEDSEYEYHSDRENGVNDVRFMSYGDGSTQEQRAPGATDQSWWSETIIYTVPEDDPLWLDTTEVYYPMINDCEVTDLDEFGIDRGNDYEGERRTDDEVVSSLKDSYSEFGKKDEFEEEFGDYARELDGEGLSTAEDYEVMKTTVEWYDREDPQGDPLDVYHGDRFVTAQNSCWSNPENPGWYRAAYNSVAEYENGTQVSRDHPDFTHWFWVCDCEDEEEAREVLGPPPSESSETEGDDGAGDDGAGDDGAEDEGTDDDGADEDDGSADDGAQDDGSEGDDGSSDDGADDSAGGDDSADDDGADDDGAGDDGAEDDSTGDDGAEDDSAGDGDDENSLGDEEDDDTTPAEEDGPGFGAVLAIAALLSAALLARFR